MKQILSEAFSHLTKGRKGVGSRSRETTEGKIFFTNPIAFYEEVTGIAGKGRATGCGVP